MDSTPPVITILGANPASVDLGASYVDAGATAYDSADGDLTAGIEAISNVNTSIAGAYRVVYLVEDTSGNQVYTFRAVQVSGEEEGAAVMGVIRDPRTDEALSGVFSAAA